MAVTGNFVAFCIFTLLLTLVTCQKNKGNKPPEEVSAGSNETESDGGGGGGGRGGNKPEGGSGGGSNKPENSHNETISSRNGMKKNNNETMEDKMNKTRVDSKKNNQTNNWKENNKNETRRPDNGPIDKKPMNSSHVGEVNGSMKQYCHQLSKEIQDLMKMMKEGNKSMQWHNYTMGGGMNGTMEGRHMGGGMMKNMSQGGMMNNTQNRMDKQKDRDMNEKTDIPRGRREKRETKNEKDRGNKKESSDNKNMQSSSNSSVIDNWKNDPWMKNQTKRWMENGTSGWMWNYTNYGGNGTSGWMSNNTNYGGNGMPGWMEGYDGNISTQLLINNLVEEWERACGNISENKDKPNKKPDNKQKIPLKRIFVGSGDLFAQIAKEISALNMLVKKIVIVNIQKKSFLMCSNVKKYLAENVEIEKKKCVLKNMRNETMKADCTHEEFQIQVNGKVLVNVSYFDQRLPAPIEKDYSEDVEPPQKISLKSAMENKFINVSCPPSPGKFMNCMDYNNLDKNLTMKLEKRFCENVVWKANCKGSGSFIVTSKKKSKKFICNKLKAERFECHDSIAFNPSFQQKDVTTLTLCPVCNTKENTFHTARACRKFTFKPVVKVNTKLRKLLKYENEATLDLEKLYRELEIKQSIQSFEIKASKNIDIFGKKESSKFQTINPGKNMTDISQLKLNVSDIDNQLIMNIYVEVSGKTVKIQAIVVLKVKACSGTSTKKNSCGDCAPEEECCIGFKKMRFKKDQCAQCYGTLENGKEQKSKCFYNKKNFTMCDHDLCSDGKCWKDCDDEPCGDKVMFCGKCIKSSSLNSAGNIKCVKQSPTSANIIGICAKTFKDIKLKSSSGDTCKLSVVNPKFIQQNKCFKNPQLFKELPRGVKCMNYIIGSSCTAGDYNVVDGDGGEYADKITVDLSSQQSVLEEKKPNDLKMNSENEINLKFSKLDSTGTYKFCYATQKSICKNVKAVMKGAYTMLSAKIFIKRFTNSFNITVKNCQNDIVASVTFTPPQCNVTTKGVYVSSSNEVTIKYHGELKINTKVKQTFKQISSTALQITKLSSIVTDKSNQICIPKNIAYCHGGSASDDDSCNYVQPIFMNSNLRIKWKAVCGMYTFEHRYKCSAVTWEMRQMNGDVIRSSNENNYKFEISLNSQRDGFKIYKKCETVVGKNITFNLTVNNPPQTTMVSIRVTKNKKSGEFKLRAIPCEKKKNQKFAFEIVDGKKVELIEGKEIEIGDNYRGGVTKMISAKASLSESTSTYVSEMVKVELEKFEYNFDVKGKDDICIPCDLTEYRLSYKIKGIPKFNPSVSLDCVGSTCPSHEFKLIRQQSVLSINTSDICGKSVSLVLNAEFQDAKDLPPISQSLTLSVGTCGPNIQLIKRRKTVEKFSITFSVENADNIAYVLHVKNDFASSNELTIDDIICKSKKKRDIQINDCSIMRSMMVNDAEYLMEVTASQVDGTNSVVTYAAKNHSPLECDMKISNNTNNVELEFQCNGNLDNEINKRCVLVKKRKKIQCESSTNDIVACNMKKTFVSGYKVKCVLSNDESSISLDYMIPDMEITIEEVNDITEEIEDAAATGDTTSAIGKIIAGIEIAEATLKEDEVTLSNVKNVYLKKALEIVASKTDIDGVKKLNLAVALSEKTDPREESTELQITTVITLTTRLEATDSQAPSRRKRRAIERDSSILPTVSFEEGESYVISFTNILYPITSDNFTVIEAFTKDLALNIRSICKHVAESGTPYYYMTTYVEAYCVELMGANNTDQFEMGQVSVEVREQMKNDYSTWKCTQSTDVYCSGFLLAIVYLADDLSPTNKSIEPYTGVSGVIGHTLKSGVYQAMVVNPEDPYNFVDINFPPIDTMIKLIGPYESQEQLKCHARIGGTWSYSACATSKLTQHSVICTCPHNVPIAVFELADYIDIVLSTTPQAMTTSTIQTETDSNMTYASDMLSSTASTLQTETDSINTLYQSLSETSTSAQSMSTSTMETATPVSDKSKVTKPFSISLIGDMTSLFNSYTSQLNAIVDVSQQVKTKLLLVESHLTSFIFLDDGMINFTLTATSDEMDSYVADIKDKVLGGNLVITDKAGVNYKVDKSSLVVDGEMVKNVSEDAEDDNKATIFISVGIGVAVFVLVAVVASIYYLKKKSAKKGKIQPNGEFGSGVQLTNTKKRHSNTSPA